MNPIYNLVIIGAGSAGPVAGVYVGHAKLKMLILEKSNPGGQAGNTAEVVNYPDIRRTSGPELVEEMKSHVRDFDVKIETAEIERVELLGKIKRLYSISGTYQSHAVATATGASSCHDGFKGEGLYSGHGVAYCVTYDGEFFNGLDILMIGGGYTATEEAIYLTRFAKSVTTVICGKDLSYTRTIAEKVIAHPKTTVKYSTLLEEAEGGSLSRRVYFQDKLTGETSVYDTGENGTFGVSVSMGYDPATELFHEQVDMDEDGYIPTDDTMYTNILGVFAAGDLCLKLPCQIVTAVVDGVVVVTSAEEYIIDERERLGLPMFEENAATAEPESEQEEDKAENPILVSDGIYLGGELKEQLTQAFQRLKKEMTIIMVVGPSNQKSLELEGFLREIEPLSDLIHLCVLQKGRDPELGQSFGTERYPLAALLDGNGRFSGVKFSGVSGGHEINSFVLGILRLTVEDKLTEEQLEKTRQFLSNTTLKIGVTFACPYCPDVVVAAHSTAIVSGRNVTAEMMDMALFPDIREEYHIMSVPALIVNSSEQATFGARSFDQVPQKTMEG